MFMANNQTSCHGHAISPVIAKPVTYADVCIHCMYVCKYLVGVIRNSVSSGNSIMCLQTKVEKIIIYCTYTCTYIQNRVVGSCS